MPGDFDLYPRITVTLFKEIKFVMRPIAEQGWPSMQRHGVYIITNKTIVQDYLDRKSKNLYGDPVYTQEKICQVVECEG